MGWVLALPEFSAPGSDVEKGIMGMRRKCCAAMVLWALIRSRSRDDRDKQIAGLLMPIATVKQLCKPSPIVTSDSLVEQVAQLENFGELAKGGSEFFKRNYFTDGLKRLVERGFERLAGRSDEGSFYLTQAMGGGKTAQLARIRFVGRRPDFAETGSKW